MMNRDSRSVPNEQNADLLLCVCRSRPLATRVRPNNIKSNMIGSRSTSLRVRFGQTQLSRHKLFSESSGNRKKLPTLFFKDFRKNSCVRVVSCTRAHGSSSSSIATAYAASTSPSLPTLTPPRASRPTLLWISLRTKEEGKVCLQWKGEVCLFVWRAIIEPNKA